MTNALEKHLNDYVERDTRVFLTRWIPWLFVMTYSLSIKLIIVTKNAAWFCKFNKPNNNSHETSPRQDAEDDIRWTTKIR